MPHVKKYEISFLSRAEIVYRIDILQLDYAGPVTVLEGAGNPFLLSYASGDESIINAIRASEATINFYNSGDTPLSAFYSDNDNEFKIEFYREGVLYWAGFVVQDSCRESFTDPPYLVQLRATDNVALLKDIPFNEAYAAAGFKTLYFNGNSTVDALTPPQLLITVTANDKDVTLMHYITYNFQTYRITSANYPSTTQLLLTIDPGRWLFQH